MGISRSPPLRNSTKARDRARVGPGSILEIGPTNFERGDDKATRHHQVRINLALDTGQYDQEMAQEDAQDYARLLDMIITSAGPWPSLGDWTTSLPIQHETVPSGATVPNAAGTVNDVFVESHVPGKVSVAGHRRAGHARHAHGAV